MSTRTRRTLQSLGMLMLIVLLCLIVTAAMATEVITMPQDLTAIEASAYENCQSVSAVTVPEGVESIGASAFKNCTNLMTITIPASVSTMGTDCLANCAPALLVRCSPDSAARTYAVNNGLDYNANTTYRALMISQLYPDTESELHGTGNDGIALAHCASSYGITNFSTTHKYDLTAEGILDAITETFSAANDNDVSMFFYSGHGFYDEEGTWLGALVGTDFNGVSASMLRQKLDTIKGRKIVIIDACHSGALIGKSTSGSSLVPLQTQSQSQAQAANSAEEFVQGFPAAFISAFSAKARDGLNTNGYYVITAAHSTESSYDARFSIGENQYKYMGAFTYHFTYGCGWDGLSDSACPAVADANGDGVISLHEAYVYARDNAAFWYPQNAQVYPSDCNSFGLFR